MSWLGLQDFVTEGSFAWADGAALGSYTNWLANQPDNGAAAAAAAQGNQVGIPAVCRHVTRVPLYFVQHCAVMRPSDGGWNDVTCDGARPYVCQTP